jgi:hypothetical protein
LGIAQWFVAAREGGTAGRTSFIFFWVWKSHSVEFCYDLAWEQRAFSLSPPLFVADRRTGYVFVWAWFLLGTSDIFYSLFILAYTAICLAVVFGAFLMGDVGDRRWGGCLLPVN